ncbi:MAG: hypothetical protein JNL01_02070 [Bdellovibrionales bacterium]|nr:hypothetical protein [Bdellovibrionales bacterium]
MKVKAGGVAQYITDQPKEVQGLLRDNGMFAWFSFKSPFVRLHVRPKALVQYKKDLARFAKTKAVVSFPIDQRIPKALVKKLVRASL